MIWIVCNLNKPYEMQHFKDAAISLSTGLKVIDPTKVQIFNNEYKTILMCEGKIVAPPNYMLNWNGCRNGKLEEQLEAALIKCGTKVCNTTCEINHFQDKFRWQLESNLKVIPSIKVHSSNLLNSVDVIEQYFNYPCVLKSDTGSLGQGVYKVTNKENLIQLSEVISMLDSTFKVHIEQYIDYAHDIRMYVVGNSYYLMERKSNGDFRANISMNGEALPFEKSKQIDSIFKQLRTKYDSVVFGVDILLTDNDYYLCEINSAPGFEGINSVINEDIAFEILNAIIK